MDGTVELREYEYRPLRDGPNNIRLIQILPGVGDGSIACQVFQYTLRNDKAFGLYESLSYVWGSSDNSHAILLKNAEETEFRRFSVTHNLHAALRRLRDSDLPRTFWIDAICINQDDLQERASQVQIMARIYAYAMSVIVWLGEEANNSSASFDLLQYVFAESQTSATSLEDQAAKLLPVADGIRALLDRSWFRRAWIVQEVAVARVVSVICGDAEVSGTIFARELRLAVMVLGETTDNDWPLPKVLVLMDHNTSNLPLLQRITALQMSTAIPSFQIAPLGELLKMFEDQEATDERDKIYALLGLSSDNALTTALRPDYTKSWSDLFRQVIKHVLGSSAIISIVNDNEEAVISDFGSPVAMVVDSSADTITAESPMFGSVPSYYWIATWPTRCSVQYGDILIQLRGARQPSIIRVCREHFDIVAISVPPPVKVTVIMVPREGQAREYLDVCWADILNGARSLSRKFTMVWEWTSRSQHNNMDHVSWIESEPGSHPNCLERCSNTSRVLDDLRLYDELCRLLLARPKFATVTTEEEHLILLEHACALRNNYDRMREYLIDLRWSIWLLSAPVNSEIVGDYWNRYGYLGTDLYELIRFAKTYKDFTLGNGVPFHPFIPTMEPFGESLFPILFPQYQPTKVKFSSYTAVERALSPHNGRYLMRLILASEQHLTQPSRGVLERARHDPIIGSRYRVILAILQEHPSTQAETDLFVQELFPHDGGFVDYENLVKLLVELSDDPALTFDLLERLAFFTQDWTIPHLRLLNFDIFVPLVDIFVRHVKDLALCHLEVLMWRTACRPFHSVLAFLYSRYSRAAFRLGKELSNFRSERWFATDSLTRWAQDAILRAIFSAMFSVKRKRRYWRRRDELCFKPSYFWVDRKLRSDSDESSITFVYPEEDIDSMLPSSYRFSSEHYLPDDYFSEEEL